MKLRIVLCLLVLFSSVGCKRTYLGMEALDTVQELSVAFSDPLWTGASVPKSEVCTTYGAKSPKSPGLIVEKIPGGADVVVVEFNDLSFDPLSSNAGHGSFKVEVPKGKTVVTVPPVPGESHELPAGVTVVKAHRGTNWGGVYLPPCSGGRGNIYQATVYAVDSKINTVLAMGKINLGRY